MIITDNAGSFADTLEAWYNAHRSTDDVKRDHAGREIQLAVAYECDSMEIAGEVETLMRQRRFDIGRTRCEANGAVEETKYVYLYRKP